MPITRPTLSTLIARMEGDIQSGIHSASPLLPRSVLRVLARVFAASVHLLYGYQQWISRQIIPDTAEVEFLERWAAVYGIYRIPATYAAGSVQVTGTSDAVVPTGTRFVADGDVEYVSTDDVTLVAGVATVPLLCGTSGASGSLADGMLLTLVSPVSGVDATGTVPADGLVAGFDAESDDALRARLLARIQDPPHGGALTDYIAWAFETPTVRVSRAWAYSLYAGAGTVGVTFAMDRVDPIPTGDEVAAVAAYVETKRPVTAQVSVFAPELLPIDVTLSVTPSTVAVKAAVEAALRNHINDAGGPGETVYLSRLNEAISGAVGEVDHVMSAPSANVDVANSELAILGDITWV